MVLAKAQAQWIPLLPPSGFVGRDHRGPFVYNPQGVIERTRRNGMGPIDFDHSRDLGDDPKSPAAGYPIDLEERNGNIWVKVAWTEAGLKAVQGREYCYLSPTFRHHAGVVDLILRAGLTNNPNLRGLAIHAVTATHIGSEQMKKEIDNNAELDKTEKAMCRQFGISESDYKRARAAGNEHTIDKGFVPAPKPSRSEQLFGNKK
jgi:phage I-like protein